MRRINASAVVVLPDPDSPTNPNRCPSYRSNDTRSTARRSPRSVVYSTVKSLMDRTGSCRPPTVMLTASASG